MTTINNCGTYTCNKNEVIDNELFSDIVETLYDEKKLSKLPKIPAPFFGLAILCSIYNSDSMDSVNSLYEAGACIGKLISPKSIEELKTIFKNTNLGNVSFENQDIIIVSDSFHGKIAKSNVKNDSFTGGFLAGCLSSIYGKKIHVKELTPKDKMTRVFKIVDTTNAPTSNTSN